MVILFLSLSSLVCFGNISPSSLGPRCRGNIEKFGEGDFEKRACGLEHLEKLHRADLSGHNHECVIYSIGSNNKWGFEEAIFNRTNCRIETFDCTMRPDITQPPEALRSRTRLHRVCLGDTDYIIKRSDGSEMQFMSWDSMNKLTGLTTQPTFLKIDIEGYEFPVLLSIINSGKQLPLQMAVEVHMVRMEHGKYRRDWHVPLIELYSYIQALYKYGGYYLIDRNDNPFCHHCSEILLAKLDCKNHPKPADVLQKLTNSAIQPKRLADSIRVSLDAKYYV